MVSPVDVLPVKYRYKRRLGRCRTCKIINHDRLECPRAREATPPSKILASKGSGSSASVMVFMPNQPQTLMTHDVPLLTPLFTKERRQFKIREVAPFLTFQGVHHGREETE